MQQMSLFEAVEDIPARFRASRNDPASSLNAAKEAEKFIGKQADVILSCLRVYPGSTSKELARKAGLDRYAVARRLPDLEKANKVFRGPDRVCDESGLNSTTWFPVRL